MEISWKYHENIFPGLRKYRSQAAQIRDCLASPVKQRLENKHNLMVLPVLKSLKISVFWIFSKKGPALR